MLLVFSFFFSFFYYLAAVGKLWLSISVCFTCICLFLVSVRSHNIINIIDAIAICDRTAIQ